MEVGWYPCFHSIYRSYYMSSTCSELDCSLRTISPICDQSELIEKQVLHLHNSAWGLLSPEPCRKLSNLDICRARLIYFFCRDVTENLEHFCSILPADGSSSACGDDQDTSCPEEVEDTKLKHQLLKKYGGYLGGLRREFCKRKKRGKLPREARQTLLQWWELHYKWPYPSVRTLSTSIQSNLLRDDCHQRNEKKES
jgi:hypothetical protein